jgi:adenine specific DNA methylase Mod
VGEETLAGNALYYGDNFAVLKNEIASESVDLIYLDPPFNSNATYNVLFKERSGKAPDAQIEAFEDTWHWGEHAEDAFDIVMHSSNTRAAELLRSLRGFLGENDMMAYLAMMAVRLIEMHRVLKRTGSLYLHCDPTASHYLKVVLDGIFGPERFQNEIIWKRHSAHSSAKRYGPVHDVILYYSRGDRFTWTNPRIGYEEAYLDKYYKYDDGGGRLYWRNSLTAAGTRKGSSGQEWRGFNPVAQGSHWKFTTENLDALDAAGKIYWPPGGGWPQIKRYRDELKGVAVSDIWDDIDKINPAGNERLGYPTQKPTSLLERIVAASTNPGEVVLDPFCGCGTAIHAAQKLGRAWIGIDVTHLAISLIERRLKDAFLGIAFEIHGTPKDLESARDLAARDKYQFQWWAVSLVNAQPFGGKKKGADGGIDGKIFFKPDGKRTEVAIVSVKGGDNINVSMIRGLKAVIEREKAPIGLFVTLAKPTQPMQVEARNGTGMREARPSERQSQRTISSGASRASTARWTESHRAPANGKISWSADSNRSRSASRSSRFARWKRVFTVSFGMPSTAAVSSMLMPSSARSMKTVRKCTGMRSIACSTISRISARAASCSGVGMRHVSPGTPRSPPESSSSATNRSRRRTRSNAMFVTMRASQPARLPSPLNPSR